MLSCEKASAKPQQNPPFPRALAEVCFKTLPFLGQPLSGPIFVHHKDSDKHPIISVIGVFWQNLSQTGITGRLETSLPVQHKNNLAGGSAAGQEAAV